MSGIIGENGFSIPEKRISNHVTVLYGNMEVAILHDVTEVPIRLTISERDAVWSDSGSMEKTIIVDTNISEQNFSFEVPVIERRFIFWKRTAVFVVKFAVSVVQDSGTIRDNTVRQYTYKGVSGNEDYNRYDNFILQAVIYWNGEFLRDTDPPSIPLDQNLVKAMLYQESRVGNDPAANIDIMQVGNPDDLAMRTLRGELQEYWIHNGVLQLLSYPEAKIESAHDSVHWGVRWLYHKAQSTTEDHRRFWRPWKEAVKRYGPGTNKYADDVWNIYTNGIKKEGRNNIQLWLPLLIPLIVFSLVWWSHMSSNTPVQYTHLLANVVSTVKYETEEILAPFDSSLRASIVIREKDWWESLEVYRVLDERKVLITLSESPGEPSILLAQFRQLGDSSLPFLEVYGITHMGHGDLYIYKIVDREALLVLKVTAVDVNPDIRFAPDNRDKYGHSECGEVFEKDRLINDFADVNDDGFYDVTISGIEIILCDSGGEEF